MEESNPKVAALGALSLYHPLCLHKPQDLVTEPRQPHLSVSTSGKLSRQCVDRFQVPLDIYPPRIESDIVMSITRYTPPSKQLNSNAPPSSLPRIPLQEIDPSSISLRQDSLQHLPAPAPDAPYLSLASIPPVPLQTPQRLLLVLDLNGTLIHRPRRASNYHPRPFLHEFLAYCLANHSLLVWSSAIPSNVSAICAKLF